MLVVRRIIKKLAKKLLKRFESVKRDSWFKNYQTMHSKQILGLRDKNNNRKNKLLSKDFKDKVILDAGCNVGSISNLCLKLGAKLVYAIDFDTNAIKQARKYFNNHNIIFSCEDLDNPLCFPCDVDTVLFLSVFGTQELEDRYSILSRLGAKCKVMYIEGHHNDSPYKYMEALLKYTNFEKIEFLGYTNDELRKDSVGRPFFRCERNNLEFAFFKNKIEEICKEHKNFAIGIVAKSAVGKTFIKKEISKMLPDDVNIYDDVKINPSSKGKYILFDYRASEYIKGMTHLFYLYMREDIRLRRLKSDPVRNDEYNHYLKAPNVDYNFLNFYSIQLQ